MVELNKNYVDGCNCMHCRVENISRYAKEMHKDLGLKLPSVPKDTQELDKLQMYLDNLDKNMITQVKKILGTKN